MSFGKKWPWVQQISFIGIGAAAIVGIMMLMKDLSAPKLVPLINVPIQDDDALERREFFNYERRSITDFKRNISFQQEVAQAITDHLKGIDGIADAAIVITWPERRLFEADHEPQTASLVITSKPGSDIAGSREKIEYIQEFLKYSVSGLKDENIVIVDKNGLLLNDFPDKKGTPPCQ